MTGPRASRVAARLRAALATAGGAGPVGCFCFVCGAPGTSPVEDATAGETFVCPAGHRSPRAFLFDGKAVFSFRGEALVHETAGALVRRGQGGSRQTLLFLRQRFPLLYTIPAGHVERGRNPEAEMRREVREETGLRVRRATRLLADENLLLDDPCRRGADLHRWHLFEAETEGTPRLSEEGRIIGWHTDAEVRALATRRLLARPVAALLRRLGFFARGGTRRTTKL